MFIDSFENVRWKRISSFLMEKALGCVYGARSDHYYPAFYNSSFRVGVGDGELIELVPEGLPIGHEAIHKPMESSVVRRFDEVYQLMDDHILNAVLRFLGEVRV